MHFEFTDSEVADCQWQAGSLQLRFSAARVLQGEGAGMVEQWMPVLLTADHAEPWEQQAPGACLGRLRHGTVLHASQRLARLPLPCHLQGVVTMELEFAQGTIVHVRCGGLALQALSGAGVQAYQC